MCFSKGSDGPPPPPGDSILLSPLWRCVKYVTLISEKNLLTSVRNFIKRRAYLAYLPKCYVLYRVSMISYVPNPMNRVMRDGSFFRSYRRIMACVYGSCFSMLLGGYERNGKRYGLGTLVA